MREKNNVDNLCIPCKPIDEKNNWKEKLTTVIKIVRNWPNLFLIFLQNIFTLFQQLVRRFQEIIY